MSSNSTSRKLKILCLHGYGQNASTFSKKATQLTTALKDIADCEFLSGPFELQIENDATRRQLQVSDPSTIQKNSDQELTRAWYRLMSSVHVGDEALYFLREYMIKKGPFDGVLGFSQGAVMASILAAMISSHVLINQDKKLPSFKFGVFISGITPRDPEKLKIYQTKLNTPSLHVWGTNDSLVSTELSKTFSSHYINPVCLAHDGGHALPKRPETIKQIVDFINKFKVPSESLSQETNGFRSKL